MGLAGRVDPDGVAVAPDVRGGLEESEFVPPLQEMGDGET
jgi:hypothetical protein